MSKLNLTGGVKLLYATLVTGPLHIPGEGSFGPSLHRVGNAQIKGLDMRWFPDSKVIVIKIGKYYSVSSDTMFSHFVPEQIHIVEDKE